MNPCSRLFLPAVVACLLVPTVTRAAPSETPNWVLGVGVEGTAGGGFVYYVNRYKYYREEFRTGDGWAASISAGRRLGPWLQLRGEFRYLRYDDRYSIATPPIYFPSQPPYAGPRGHRQLAEIPSLGLGVRFDVPALEPKRINLFLEFLPTAYLASWTEEFDYGGGRVDEYHMTKMRGGVALGMGMRLRPMDQYHLEVGPRYNWSGDIGWTLDRENAGAGQSLSEFTVGARLVRPL